VLSQHECCPVVPGVVSKIFVMINRGNASHKTRLLGEGNAVLTLAYVTMKADPQRLFET